MSKKMCFRFFRAEVFQQTITRKMFVLTALLMMYPISISGETVRYPLSWLVGKEINVHQPTKGPYDLGQDEVLINQVSIELEGFAWAGEAKDPDGYSHIIDPQITAKLGDWSTSTSDLNRSFDVSPKLYNGNTYALIGQGEVEIRLGYPIAISWTMRSYPTITISRADLVIETVEPGITVIFPDGEENWLRGTSQKIIWTSSGILDPNNKIELYKGGILDHIIINSTPNNGFYNWSIPGTQTVGSDYMVKITSTSNTSFYDYSDSTFSINSEVVFEDSFSSEVIDKDKWPVVHDATVDNMGTNEPTPEFSLRLNGHPSGGDLIESRVIDLSLFSEATLTYGFERTGQGESSESGEDLIIDYNDGLSWIELDRQPGGGPDMDYYEEVTIPLPSEALHTEFKLRIRNIGSSHDSEIYDDWFVDDVKIVVDANKPVREGSLVAWGNKADGRCDVPAGDDYVAVSAGWYHSLALKSDGSIVGWGSNDAGQAIPPAGNDFVAIAAGAFHSLAIKSDGSIMGWGSQATPPAGTDFVAIATKVLTSLALKSDGSIVGWGYGQATPPAGTDFVAIAAGGSFSLALTLDGSIVGWGSNLGGQATPPPQVLLWL